MELTFSFPPLPFLLHVLLSFRPVSLSPMIITVPSRAITSRSRLRKPTLSETLSELGKGLNKLVSFPPVVVFPLFPFFHYLFTQLTSLFSFDFTPDPNSSSSSLSLPCHEHLPVLHHSPLLPSSRNPQTNQEASRPPPPHPKSLRYRRQRHLLKPPPETLQARSRGLQGLWGCRRSGQGSRPHQSLLQLRRGRFGRQGKMAGREIFQLDRILRSFCEFRTFVLCFLDASLVSLTSLPLPPLLCSCLSQIIETLEDILFEIDRVREMCPRSRRRPDARLNNLLLLLDKSHAFLAQVDRRTMYLFVRLWTEVTNFEEKKRGIMRLIRLWKDVAEDDQKVSVVFRVVALRILSCSGRSHTDGPPYLYRDTPTANPSRTPSPQPPPSPPPTKPTSPPSLLCSPPSPSSLSTTNLRRSLPRTRFNSSFNAPTATANPTSPLYPRSTSWTPALGRSSLRGKSSRRVGERWIRTERSRRRMGNFTKLSLVTRWGS